MMACMVNVVTRMGTVMTWMVNPMTWMVTGMARMMRYTCVPHSGSVMADRSPNARHLFPHRFALVSSLEPNRHLRIQGQGSRCCLRNIREYGAGSTVDCSAAAGRFIDSPITRAATAQTANGTSFFSFSHLLLVLVGIRKLGLIEPVLI